MSGYAVYLTVYRGNKLPPFYIGSTSVSNLERGYKGSVCSLEYKRLWKTEDPSLFTTHIICITESRSEASRREKELQTKLRVLGNPLYTNRNIAGKRFAPWTKEKLESMRQKLRRPQTPEHIRAVVEARRGTKRPDVAERNRLMKGVPRPDVSRALRGRKRPDISQALLGKKNPEHSKRLTGRPQPQLRRQITCACGVTCQVSNYKRWHGKNCKRLRYV